MSSEEHLHTWPTYQKRSSTSLIVGDVHMKTTLSYDLTPVRMMIMKETGDDKCG